MGESDEYNSKALLLNQALEIKKLDERIVQLEKALQELRPKVKKFCLSGLSIIDNTLK